jgi:hypothetical protein
MAKVPIGLGDELADLVIRKAVPGLFRRSGAPGFIKVAKFASAGEIRMIRSPVAGET